MRNRILISNFNPTHYQMGSMFSDASAFNQPLSSFDTVKVTYVRACLC